jgi:hypothetical protein
MRRRITGAAILAALSMLLVGLLAAPAAAEVIQGPCVGFADFSNGTHVDQSTPVSVVNKVPVEDDVVYAGDTTLAEPPEEEPFEGHVSVRLPAGGSWVVVDWPEPAGSETKQTAAAGTYHYDVPGWVPKGTGGLEVTAYHVQRGQICEVVVTMALDGNPSAAAWIGAAGTAVFGAGVVGAGFKRRFS